MRFFDQNIWGNYSAPQQIANRSRLITDMIFDIRPDVCCFQECNPKTSRAGDEPLPRLLQARYAEAASEYASRNFTPVFYNRDTVNLLASGYLPFPGRNDVNSKSITWAVLEDKKSGKAFAACSVHYWYKNAEETDEWQRVENARFSANICQMIQNEYHVPVFLMGDLNDHPAGPFGGLALEEMEKLGFRDTRFLAENTTKEFTWHPAPTMNEQGLYTPGPRPERVLDYIYLYQDGSVRCKRFSVLTDDRAQASSDHCPLVLDFDLL